MPDSEGTDTVPDETVQERAITSYQSAPLTPLLLYFCVYIFNSSFAAVAYGNVPNEDF